MEKWIKGGGKKRKKYLILDHEESVYVELMEQEIDIHISCLTLLIDLHNT